MGEVGVFRPVSKEIGQTVTVYLDKRIQFRDSGLYVGSSADGVLDIVSDTTLNLTATTIATSGAWTNTGDFTVTGDLTVTGDFAFGNAAADTMTVAGDIVYGASTAAYLIDMNAATPATADMRFSNGATAVATSANELTITEPTISLVCSTLVSLEGPTTISGANAFTTGTGAVTVKGDMSIDAGKDFDMSAGAGTFATGTGAISLNGDMTIAAGADIGVSAGDSAIDFSNGTGLFKTTSGANTLSGDVTISGSKTFATGTGAVTINGALGLATTIGYTSGTGSAIGGTHIIYQDGAGAMSLHIIPGTSIALAETNISLTGAIKLDGTVTLDDDGTIADASDVMTLTQDTITLAGATAINLDGPTTQTGAFAMDSIVAGSVFSIAAFGDGTGLAMTDSYLDAAAFYMELPSGGAAITAGNVLRGIRTRFLINQAQTNNISIYANTGHIRVKANLAAGVHVGQMCYYEQSGTSAVATGGIEAAMAATVESASTFTIDSGALLCAGYFSSNIDASATINGEFVGVQIRKASGKLDFVTGLEFQDCMSGSAFKFADDQTICSDDNQSILVDISGTTNDGFIKVVVGSADKYIALYDLKSS